MYTLVAFATRWGSKFGGINSFNEDFLSAFGYAFHTGAKVVCIAAEATEEDVREAAKSKVELVPLPYRPGDVTFGLQHALAVVDELRRFNHDPGETVWLGHDRITGEAAIEAASIAGGRSAVIHHMSYDHYESYAETSQSAYSKGQAQKGLFARADVVLAIGPLLRDAARDIVGGGKPVHMLIPGLAEIDAKAAPNTFTAFLSGRLSADAARIKQGHLGIAAFARAIHEARRDSRPVGLKKQPKLLLRGVDVEGEALHPPSTGSHNDEHVLKKFAEDYAGAVINLHALPFTQDRAELYSELSGASVALMPSWHEGFGLVAWEAIAAGVPLIISKNSGVYRFLEEEYPAEEGNVYALDVLGKLEEPFFHEKDLEATVEYLKKIADDPAKARRKAAELKNTLGDYTWSACAEEAARAFGWELRKGSVPGIATPALSPQGETAVSAPPRDDAREPLQIPNGQWRAGMSDSQLLRAEEELLPFDSGRQPEVDALNAWLDEDQCKTAVRLVTGAGGQGKTRLALEICGRRRDAGWFAGFLESRLEANSMHAVWESLRRRGRPLLVVIDYAETRQEVLLALLREAVQNPSDEPLRMLLLARDGGEWWDDLPGKDEVCEGLLSGRATSGPFRLPPLYREEADRLEAYGISLDRFAQKLEATAPDMIPDLRGDYFERPLYVQMAALLALYGERPTTAQGLTKALLYHERRYWEGVLAQYDLRERGRRAEQLLALTTLAGGFATSREAEPYWRKAKGDVLSAAEFNMTFRALATLYPGEQGLQALRPDLLGEALVAQALLRAGAETLPDAVLSNEATRPVRRNALTVLARLSNHRPDLNETLTGALARHFNHCCMEIYEVGKETGSFLPSLAESSFESLTQAQKSQAAGQLSSKIMEESVQLAGLNYRVSGHLVEKCGRKYESKRNNPQLMEEYTGALVNHATTSARMGLAQQALAVSEKGVHLFKKFKERNRAKFEPDYARSLNNYASYLSYVGRYEDALAHARQAPEIHERLAGNNPDRFGEQFFSISCFVQFLAWLCEKGVGEAVESDERILPLVQPHLRPLMLLYSEFVKACLSTDQESRGESMRRVLSLWGEHTPATKVRGDEYRLCAAAWCSAFSPTDLEDAGWEDDFRRYIQHRDGRPPQRMQDVARRMNFKGPI